MAGGGLAYVLRKAGSAILTLTLVSVLVFVSVRLIPGDYVDLLLGPFATEQQRILITEKYGLDQPLPLQYLTWLGHVIRGDLGETLGTGTPVVDLVGLWIPVTLELTAFAFIFTVVVGSALALVAGTARGRAARGVSRIGAALAMSTPDFVIGSIFLFVFSQYALGLTTSGYVPFAADPVGNIRSMILPSVTLGVFGVALVTRTGRDSVANVMGMPHVLAALSRGERRLTIIRRHVVRNASIPVVTVLATYVGYLLGGAVIVETLFSLPGIGQAAIAAISQRDYPVIQAIVLLAAAAFILVNMLADALYGVIDRRVEAVPA